MSPRLRRADCSSPGLTRRKAGKGFTYLDADGERVTEPEDVERIAELGIPPAWKDVWICPDSRGHLQATGIDAAGRKQYLYHPQWRTRRDSEKFDEMLRFAAALPKLREVVDEHLESSDELTRDRVLACAVRLLDRGFFRIGSEQYTAQNESYGLATMRKEHVTLDPEMRGMVFDYVAKSGKRRIQGVVDPAAFDVVSALKRRRGGGPELLAYKNGRSWADVRSPDINEYLKEATGDDFSAKDFRTWAATMLAAIGLAVVGRGGGHADRPQARRRARGQGGLALPRQHAGGLPRLLHRPARDRPLQRRADDRRRARGDRRHRRGRRDAAPPAGGRAGRARPAQRARDVAGSGAGGGLSGASRRRSAGPPVTPCTTIETITHAIAVHTTSFSSPPPR